ASRAIVVTRQIGRQINGATKQRRDTDNGATQTDGPAMKPNFRTALAAEQPLILFGAYDALSARLIERAGCAACFVSGFSIVGSRFGVQIGRASCRGRV